MNGRVEGKPRKQIILLGAAALLTASLLVAGCTSKEDKARDDLAKLSLSYTPDSFVQAAANNDQRALQLFVDAGMTPDAKDAEDETALMVASQNGNIEAIDLVVAEYLLQRKRVAAVHDVQLCECMPERVWGDPNVSNASLLAVQTDTFIGLVVRQRLAVVQEEHGGRTAVAELRSVLLDKRVEKLRSVFTHRHNPRLAVLGNDGADGDCSIG